MFTAPLINNDRTKFKTQLPYLAAALNACLLSLAILGTTGCGKQAFQVTQSTVQMAAPGTYSIPPRVDLLMAVDNSGSMATVYSQLESQLPAFLNQLNDQGWDFHFASTPINDPDKAITQIVGSRFDPSWGTDWTPPFPGATAQTIQTINPKFFVKPNAYSEFVSRGNFSDALSGQELGFYSLSTALKTRLGDSGFLRQDALLVLIVMSNGEDTSGVKLCDYNNGTLKVSCELVGQSGTWQSSLNDYRTFFNASKPSTNQVKFYSAVSPQNSSSCLGSGAYRGERYINMTKNMGGTSYDICTQKVPDILNSIKNDLVSARKDYYTHYLFLEQDADPTTINLVKLIDGDPKNAVSIAQDAQNGWTYAGYLEKVYAIDSPVPMNLSSGYAIELHGLAKLKGLDKAQIGYQIAGSHSTISK